jgi:hypothetical protein
VDRAEGRPDVIARFILESAFAAPGLAALRM